ncbi:hypothetical protein BSL78_04004 [Apostichopus japonicus]|uniref:DUF6570 domain-containing protein n=1 Tax=Stichopus japonicus TaxID=307972 RepID=A0A2G8LFM4_STIJA|nr:hypothetical protein BSL78_04004 [Apostichopus japonicus]
MNRKRSDEDYCRKETETNKKRINRKRLDEDYCKKENETNKKRMKRKRLDEDYCRKETETNQKRMNRKRLDEDYCGKETETNKKRMNRKRLDEDYCRKETETNQKRMNRKRLDEDYCRKETETNKKRIGKKRLNEDYCRKESESNVKRMANIRLDEAYVDMERRSNKKRIQALRQQNAFKLQNVQQMQLNRSNKKYVEKESVSEFTKVGSRNTTSFEALQQQFWQSVSVGQEYVCFICEKLLYKHSVISAKPPMYGQWICRTCHQYVTAGKVPPLSKENNMLMADIPEELKLHSLEERLVAARTPFMQIRELPRGRQLNIKGNVVNVPADVSTTVRSLPRRMDESQTIPVKFKRKLSYKHSVHRVTSPFAMCMLPIGLLLDEIFLTRCLPLFLVVRRVSWSETLTVSQTRVLTDSELLCLQVPTLDHRIGQIHFGTPFSRCLEAYAPV